MRPAQYARKQLRGNWDGAISIQCGLLAAALLLLLLEMLSLRGLGLSSGTALSFQQMLRQPGGYRTLWVMIGALVMDLFALSPLYAGKALYFRALSLQPVDAAADDSPHRVPVRLFWHFFKGGKYGLSVRWRLSIWALRLGYSFLLFLPAALALGYGDWLGQQPQLTPMLHVSRIFALFLGLFGLVAGFAGTQMLMLRYMPAQYFLNDCTTARQALRLSRHLMRGRVERAAGLYVGFSGWWFCCLLILPCFYVLPLFAAARAEEVMRMTSVFVAGSAPKRSHPAAPPEANRPTHILSETRERQPS